MEINREEMENMLKELQEPVQYQILSLLSLLKSQRVRFENEALWGIYLTCIKQGLEKDYEKLYDVGETNGN